MCVAKSHSLIIYLACLEAIPEITSQVCTKLSFRRRKNCFESSVLRQVSEIVDTFREVKTILPGNSWLVKQTDPLPTCIANLHTHILIGAINATRLHANAHSRDSWIFGFTRCFEQFWAQPFCDAARVVAFCTQQRFTILFADLNPHKLTLEYSSCKFCSIQTRLANLELNTERPSSPWSQAESKQFCGHCKKPWRPWRLCQAFVELIGDCFQNVPHRSGSSLALASHARTFLVPQSDHNLIQACVQQHYKNNALHRAGASRSHWHPSTNQCWQRAYYKSDALCDANFEGKSMDLVWNELKGQQLEHNRSNTIAHTTMVLTGICWLAKASYTQA